LFGIFIATGRVRDAEVAISAPIQETRFIPDKDAMQDRQRRQALLSELEKENLDALVCFVPEDVLLVSGYWPVMASSLAVLSREGALHIILPEDELELATATAEAEFLAYKPGTLDRLSTVVEALEQPIDTLAKQLRLGSARVGVLLHDTSQTQSYQSGNHFHSAITPLLRRAYPDVALAPADVLLRRAKSIKTLDEVRIMRHLCQLAQAGFDAAREAIAPGRREDEIIADISRAYAYVAQDGFERGGGYFFCMSGPNSTKAAAAFARTRQRVVESGDLVMIHANTVGDGFGRTSPAPTRSVSRRIFNSACAEQSMKVELPRWLPFVRARRPAQWTLPRVKFWPHMDLARNLNTQSDTAWALPRPIPGPCLACIQSRPTSLKPA